RVDYAASRTVELTGAVRYPGRYELPPGSRLSDVIQRAGGLTEDAYMYGAVLTRPSLADEEQRFVRDLVQTELLYIERELARLEDLPLTTDERERRWRALDHRMKMLELLQGRTPQGRIILDVRPGDNDLPQAVAGLPLHDGDQLHVPHYSGTVLVVGAVYMPGALLHTPGWDIEDYLKQLGGPLREGDAEGIYVVKANGRVETRFSGFTELHAGDTIVVPYKDLVQPAPIVATYEEDRQ